VNLNGLVTLIVWPVKIIVLNLKQKNNLFIAKNVIMLELHIKNGILNDMVWIIIIQVEDVIIKIRVLQNKYIQTLIINTINDPNDILIFEETDEILQEKQPPEVSPEEDGVQDSYSKPEGNPGK